MPNPTHSRSFGLAVFTALSQIYAPWKQISNLLNLASSQLGITLRIENNGSTSWKPLYAPARGLLVMIDGGLRSQPITGLILTNKTVTRKCTN